MTVKYDIQEQVQLLLKIASVCIIYVLLLLLVVLYYYHYTMYYYSPSFLLSFSMNQDHIKVFKWSTASHKNVESSSDIKQQIISEHQHNQSGYLVSDRMTRAQNDPFSPYCIIPLPTPFGLGRVDSACFRRRNERERERIRCVNDGYIRLKEHLPIDNKEKRMSKVETLRYAIQYIKHLEHILGSNENSRRSPKCVLKYEQNKDSSTKNISKTKPNNRLPCFEKCSSREHIMGSYDYETEYDILNYSSDFTDMSSDTETSN